MVNPADWIDVEYVIRKMLKCHNSECHAFHTMGYIYFRSSAVCHVAQPGDYLQDGTHYRFPDSEVVVEIEKAHPEGILEVVCYLEYSP